MKTRQKAKSTSPPASRRKKKAAPLQLIHPRAAGIDIGATEHYVAVPPDCIPAGEPVVWHFKSFTEDLDAMVEWLKVCGVNTVAMEAAGIYWIPPLQKIEAAGIEGLLVNARHGKHVPGRKTDVQDFQWLEQLDSYWLLKGTCFQSFKPGSCPR